MDWKNPNIEKTYCPQDEIEDERGHVEAKENHSTMQNEKFIKNKLGVLII